MNGLQTYCGKGKLIENEPARFCCKWVDALIEQAEWSRAEVLWTVAGAELAGDSPLRFALSRDDVMPALLSVIPYLGTQHYGYYGYKNWLWNIATRAEIEMPEPLIHQYSTATNVARVREKHA